MKKISPAALAAWIALAVMMAPPLFGQEAADEVGPETPADPTPTPIDPTDGSRDDEEEEPVDPEDPGDRAPLAPAPITNYADDHANRIKSAEAVGTLGTELFGEQVNMYTGSTQFVHSDLDIPGNSSLPVRAGRRFFVTGRKFAPTSHAFGDWELDVPYISGTYTAAAGWQVNTSSPNNRCSSPANLTQAAPPWYSPPNTTWAFSPYEIWNGSTIYIPGQGEQSLLFNEGALGSAAPASTYKWVTKDFWRISCGVTLVNGAGEGFVAQTPDGTRYTFNRLASHPTSGLAKSLGSGFNAAVAPRNEYRLYVTRVEDRFGNWVDYEWSGATPATNRLNRIVGNAESSSQRILTFNYPSSSSTRVASISDGTRAVSFHYTSGEGTGRLSSVNYADGSAWTINLAAAHPDGNDTLGPRVAPWDPSTWETVECAPGRTLRTSVGVATMTHPSGAHGRFEFKYQWHIRSGVPLDRCFHLSSDGTHVYSMYTQDKFELEPKDYTSDTPRAFDTLAIKRKQISGPGLLEMNWDYSYDNNTAGQPYDSAAFPSRRFIKVVEPDGSSREFVFGRRYEDNEGQLLQQITRSPSGTVVQHTTHTYVLSAQGFPNRTGVNPNRSLDNFSTELLRPLQQTRLRQDSVDYYRTVQSYDAYANPQRVQRNSHLASRTDEVQYLNNTSLWVLGQVERSTNIDTGKIESRRTFHSAKAQPWKEYSFERLTGTYTYHADGNLHTATDGRNQTTTLSSYFRGVPRNIAFPDYSYIAAGVNSIGRISWARNQAGTTTSYGYDTMGRLSSITPPADTGMNWYPTSMTFQRASASSYGLPAGHWQQVTSTGFNQRIVYFDALWRPVLTREYDSRDITGTSRLVGRAFDYAGRETFVSYPEVSASSWLVSGNGNHSFYDELGRPVSQQQDSEHGRLVTQFSYSLGQKRITDPRGYVTQMQFQSFDAPDYGTPTGVALPENVLVTIQRDRFGKPTSIIRSGSYAGTPLAATRSYVYDSHERLCKRVDPESMATLFDYDAAGNLAWSTDGHWSTALSCDRHNVAAADRTTRSYDGLNRLLSVTYPGLPGQLPYTESYSYEPDGQLRTASSPHVTWTYRYNNRRLLIGEDFSSDGMSFNYAYDPHGHLSSTVYPGNLFTVSHAPNALGQPTAAGAYASNAKYYPNGALKEFTFGNGIRRTVTQTTRGLPFRVQDRYGSSAAVSDFQYGYDRNANIDAITDFAQGGLQNRSMTYDGLDRLLTAKAPYVWGNAAYAYDALDNLRVADVDSRKYRYHYDAVGTLGSIKSATGANLLSFSHDARGNQTGKSGLVNQAYTFDHANRINKITGMYGAVLGEYYYDAHGRRWGFRRADGSPRYAVYTRDGRLRGGYDAGLGGTEFQIYLGSTLVAKRFQKDGVVTNTYHHTDLLGSPVVDTSASRVVLDRSYYEPYGEISNRSVNGSAYTGHYRDQDTGLTYMQARYYDPLTARFLSIDPVDVDAGTGGNFNRYWYANNNPYKYTDPDGRFAKCGGSLCELWKGLDRGPFKIPTSDSDRFRLGSPTNTANSTPPSEGSASKISGAQALSAATTGTDLGAAAFGCAVGACPGKAINDWVLKSNTAPIRLMGKAALVGGVGIEIYEFDQARRAQDRIGMLDATADTAAMLPALFGGVLGVTFSASYAIGDNLLAPIIVPPMVDGACAITGTC